MRGLTSCSKTLSSKRDKNIHLLRKFSGILSGSKSIKMLSRNGQYHFYPCMCDIIFDQSLSSTCGFYSILTKRKLHGCLEIHVCNFTSDVEKYYTCSLHSLVFSNIFQHLKRNFIFHISARPCNMGAAFLFFTYHSRLVENIFIFEDCSPITGIGYRFQPSRLQ